MKSPSRYTSAPTCMKCGDELTSSVTEWPLNDERKRRFIDTGFPCGHVQLDTVLEPDGLTIGQYQAATAAAAIRFAAVGFVMHPAEWSQAMLGLADLVEHYDGLTDCVLCPGKPDERPHHDTCPLRTRTEEWS